MPTSPNKSFGIYWPRHGGPGTFLLAVTHNAVSRSNWLTQVLLTVRMWLACRKYHPTFGVPGTELRGTLEEQIIELGRGWEWWPSALWQVVWVRVSKLSSLCNALYNAYTIVCLYSIVSLDVP